jgi:hypothetical protein
MEPFQQLKPLLVNPDWTLFETYLAAEKSRLVIQLCNCKEDELKSLQGQIKTIDSILRLKSTLKTEQERKR